MSREQSHITDDLLVKYLLGEATDAEQVLVAEWIQAGEENAKYYNHFKLVWDASKNIAAKSNVNEDEAWARFVQRTQREAIKPKVIAMPAPRKTNWVRAAAILLVVVTCGLLLKLTLGSSEPKMIAMQSHETILIDTLPDGSVVTLNKNASITYPETFTGDTREVALEGEAFFNVTPDKSKPFIITANEARIRVVGTSFNVKTGYTQTVVIVETGVVEVSKKENEVTLNPNEKATVSKDKENPVKQQVTDELYNYYRTKEFVCNNTPLWRLADVLNEAYGVKIIITDDRLRNLPLTTVFRNESLDMILGVIAETFNIRVEKEGNTIYLK